MSGDLATAHGAAPSWPTPRSALGGVDVLVNSAANFVASAFADTTEDEVDRALAVNLKGPFFCAQAAAPAMTEAGFGRIVNLADVAGLEPWPRFTAHSVAKAGVVMLTRSLAQALAPADHGQRRRPGDRPDARGRLDEGATRRSVEKTVLERVGSPDDVARAIRYLLEADYVTGHVLVVDGGRLVRP